MNARARFERWPLRAGFGISRGLSTESYVLHVELECDGVLAHGEAEAAEFQVEDAERCAAECQTRLDGLDAACTRERLQHELPAGPIRNAIDCALWDLEAKRARTRAWTLAGIIPRPVRTLYTIGLDEPDVMHRAAAAHADWPWLKVKLGAAGDLERLQAVHDGAPGAKLLVDANGGWTLEELDRYAPRFAQLGVAVIEQPLAPGPDRALARWDGPLPLCADESCTDRASLESLPGGYRMINIKLDKAGGLTEALRLASEARARGLGVMVGCNLGTSLAMAPAMLVARSADIVDLDGPLLLASDRESGLKYEKDLIHWPAASLWG